MAASATTWESEEEEMMETMLDSSSETEIGSEDSADGSESTEWDQVREQGAAEKRDHHANPNWQTSLEEETGAGWSCSSADIGDDDFGSTDSGYGTLATTPLEERLPSPAEVKYLGLPFKTKHYFLTYLQRILERVCLRYARENLSEQLGDLEWKKRFLVQGSGDAFDCRFVVTDWLAEDGAELQNWMQMFANSDKYTGMPRNIDMMNAVVILRNAAVHRGDCEDFDFEVLSSAMEYPSLLGDSEGASDMSAAFRHVMDDPTLDQDTKARVESAMYTPQPCTTAHQLLGRIQTLLEEACFNYAARKIPQWLEEKGWTMPEEVELPKWANVFHGANVQHDATANAFCPAPDSETANTSLPGFESDYLVYMIHYARKFIRNVVAHHKPMLDEDLIQEIHQAIKICIVQGDWDRAIEIEVLAEMFLTQRSRAQVRERLQGAFQEGRIDNQYEDQRRIAMAAFLDIDSTRHDQHSHDPCLPPCYEAAPGEDQVPWTWSPSMHDCLRIRKSSWWLDAGFSSSSSGSDTATLTDEEE